MNINSNRITNSRYLIKILHKFKKCLLGAVKVTIGIYF